MLMSEARRLRPDRPKAAHIVGAWCTASSAYKIDCGENMFVLLFLFFGVHEHRPAPLLVSVVAALFRSGTVD